MMESLDGPSPDPDLDLDMSSLDFSCECTRMHLPTYTELTRAPCQSLCFAIGSHRLCGFISFLVSAKRCKDSVDANLEGWSCN